jgi:hypothetical protein
MDRARPGFRSERLESYTRLLALGTPSARWRRAPLSRCKVPEVFQADFERHIHENAALEAKLTAKRRKREGMWRLFISIISRIPSTNGKTCCSSASRWDSTCLISAGIRAGLGWRMPPVCRQAIQNAEDKGKLVMACMTPQDETFISIDDPRGGSFALA